MMGAAGAGKTTIGRALAAELGWRFFDADDYHPSANVAKMRAAQPLTDADRAPWIATLASIVGRAIDRREHTVLACSALKMRYRLALADDHRSIRFVYLKASETLLRERLQNRPEHFMPSALVASQLRDLEEPADALTVDASRRPEEVLDEIRHEFGV